MELVSDVKTILDQRFRPAGYNVGFNAGAEAGQTIDHLHVHVIPRYPGDVPDPRGGIRNVIPNKGNYLEPLLNGASDSPRLFDASTTDQRLRVELLRCLNTPLFDRIDLVVSFIMSSGLDIVLPNLRDAIDRGAKVRFLTTDYMDITDPDALSDLLDLCDEQAEDAQQLEVKVWRTTGESFHPKAYLFHSASSAAAEGFVGSSNLSRSGIDGGIEWNLGTKAVNQLRQSFELLWSNPSAVGLTHELLRDYRGRRVVIPLPAGREAVGVAQEQPREPVSPTPIQVEALERLTQTRQEGFAAGLVVMATGLGKTWLSAFDSTRPAFRRTLFVAHREEILAQSRDVFRRVRPSADLGLYYGKDKSPDSEVVFASVQTLSRHLDEFEATAFDYIVIDEFHHASASSYRQLIEHFAPSFLLGLTATPDRMDGADLLALCDDNLVFECNLVEGIKRDELVAFQYQGLKDLVDFTPIPWRNGKFDPEALAEAFETNERAGQSLEAWREYGQGPTLGFCVSIAHARFMAGYFTGAGVSAVAVHSGLDSAPRRESVSKLRSGEVAVVFTVDLFNEGLDVPEIGTVLMLRPTESPVVFLQQLGRGLRKAANKDRLRVVDFIGNHRSFLNKPRTLLSLGGRAVVTQKDVLDAARSGEFDLPEGCSVEYELEAVDLLESLVKARSSMSDVLADYCREFFDDYGYRPSALQAFRAQLNPRSATKQNGSWFGLLKSLGILTPEEAEVVERRGDTLRSFAREETSRSYKLVTIEALIEKGQLRQAVDVGDLCRWSRERVIEDPRLISDVESEELGDVHEASDSEWASYWTKWPIRHLAGSKHGALFQIAGERFAPTFAVPETLGSTFDAMVAELIEWRLAEYLLRPSVVGHGSSGGIRCRVSHSGGSPIIRIDRAKYAYLPTEPTEVLVDGEPMTFNFVKIAVNVARREGEAGNALHPLLRSWFGPSAGWPGTRHEVIFEETPAGWTVRASDAEENVGNVIPLFPTYEVACGVAEATEPLRQGSVIEVTLDTTISIDPERDFVVFARGESMAGGQTPIHHGDPLLFEWAQTSAEPTLWEHGCLCRSETATMSRPTSSVSSEQQPASNLSRTTTRSPPSQHRLRCR